MEKYQINVVLNLQLLKECILSKYKYVINILYYLIKHILKYTVQIIENLKKLLKLATVIN